MGERSPHVGDLKWMLNRLNALGMFSYRLDKNLAGWRLEKADGGCVSPRLATRKAIYDWMGAYYDGLQTLDRRGGTRTEAQARLFR